MLGLLDDLDRHRFIVFRSLTLLRRLALSPLLIDVGDAAGAHSRSIRSAKLEALHGVRYDPASEIGKGHGLAYYEAVKVNALPDGTVEITEPDGDRFHVGTNGQLIAGKGFQPVTRRGSPSGGPLSKVYVDAPGTPQRYFGRGLVQLTWWNGYAATSAAMGWKLELLVDPDRMLDFEVSYEVMVRGMTTGIGYANNLTLGMYLSDSTTDYKGARAIINGKDRADEFAAIALRLEAILMDARQP